nr:MAG TPA: hypothetical protein [Caudoviricetes sp.]
MNSHFLCIFAHTRYVFILFLKIFASPPSKNMI